jgi:hypothetical protein
MIRIDGKAGKTTISKKSPEDEGRHTWQSLALWLASGAVVSAIAGYNFTVKDCERAGMRDANRF